MLPAEQNRASLSSDAVLHHFGERAETYAASCARAPWSWLRRRECDAVFHALGDVKERAVLDLGCGAGFYACQALVRGASAVTGIDKSPEMVRATPRLAGLHVQQGDAEALEVAGVFDRIVCAGLLEFAASPMLVLSGARQVVRDNGWMVVLIPRESWVARRYAGWHSRHGIQIKLFSSAFLGELARQTNWVVADIWSVWPMSHVVRLDPAL
ncbi:MAG: hypothetical protein CMF67_10935 [Magnetovibrio sp.]|nr:hypothetical protein [Magnetovibrio sp.]|tara:strand:+ start:733 stop:1368 length:636 start_codon:yes stop_codon:yes gene_type:complete